MEGGRLTRIDMIGGAAGGAGLAASKAGAMAARVGTVKAARFELQRVIDKAPPGLNQAQL